MPQRRPASPAHAATGRHYPACASQAAQTTPPAPGVNWQQHHTLHVAAEGRPPEMIMHATPIRAFALLAALLILGGCSSLGPGGPPHPGAVNPYSSGGFHDAGPNYPDTGP